MSLRSFVTGSDVCAPSDVQRRRNAVGTLADTLLERTNANDRAREGGPSSSANVQNFFENALTPEEREKLSEGVIPEDHPVTLEQPQFREFDQIFGEIASQQPHLGPPVHFEERDHALSQAFKHFMACARDDVEFVPMPFPQPLRFEPLEQQKIASRVQHLCHVIFAEHGAEMAERQATRFLQGLQIEPVTSQFDAFHQVWNDSALRQDWIQDFSKLHLSTPEPQHHPWATQFSQQQHQLPSSSTQDTSETQDISSALIHQMANDADPKFRNSKFLQFVQRLNSGQLVIEDNQVREVSTVEKWASEFAAQYPESSSAWVNAFNQQTTVDFTEAWKGESGALEGGWLESTEIEEWVENYRQMAYGSMREDQEYQFSSQNPYLNNPNALSIASDLFRQGNLSEAVQAGEAEVQSRPDNIDAWILLGKVHAENDNDPQAIAALSRARRLDPSHLTVLLDLGVCHANELHEQRTVEALMSWLRQHPTYHSHPQGWVYVCADPSQMLSHAMNVFHQVLTDWPSDVDLCISLGVLHHLGRNFEEAISLFHSAVRQRPDDYSLWNKLGATQANAAKSGDAIEAYKRALELKSNYMRGWANLGISNANLGDYSESVRHYVRALSLNPASETVWSYLKSSAICAGMMDLLETIDKRDITTLRNRLN